MFVLIGTALIIFLVSNMYAYKMLNVSDDDFQNGELMMEGIGNSAGIFMVSNLTSVAHFCGNLCFSEIYARLTHVYFHS